MRAFHHRGRRIELVTAVRQGSLSLEAAVETAGITPSQLLSWLRECGSTCEPSLDDLRLSARDQQLRELRRQVRRLELRLATLRSEQTQLLRVLASTSASAKGLNLPPEFGDTHPHGQGDVALRQRDDRADANFSLTTNAAHS